MAKLGLEIFLTQAHERTLTFFCNCIHFNYFVFKFVQIYVTMINEFCYMMIMTIILFHNRAKLINGDTGKVNSLLITF